MGEVRALGVCMVGEDHSGSRSYVRKNFMLIRDQRRWEKEKKRKKGTAGIVDEI